MRETREVQPRQGTPSLVTLGPGVFRQVRHGAFLSIHLQQCLAEDQHGATSTSLQTVLQCRRLVTVPALQALLRYLYTGELSLHPSHLHQLSELAKVLELDSLCQYLSQLPLSGDVSQTLTDSLTLGTQLERVCQDETFFPDVTFQLEDGVEHGHKALLVARSDMMAAMFSDKSVQCGQYFHQLVIISVTAL